MVVKYQDFVNCQKLFFVWKCWSKSVDHGELIICHCVSVLCCKAGNSLVRFSYITQVKKFQESMDIRIWCCDMSKMLLTVSQTTKFRLFQTQWVCRRHFQICWKWQNTDENDRKRCGKRWNCLSWAISPFPTVFSKDLYCSHVKNKGLLGKELTIYHTCLTFNYPQKLLKTVLGKEKMLVISIFSFTHSGFYSFKMEF